MLQYKPLWAVAPTKRHPKHGMAIVIDMYLFHYLQHKREKLGGGITVATQEGKVTTFTIWVPAN